MGYEKLDYLKKEYMETPIPEALDFQVNKALHQSRSKLVISFDEYEVAPGYMGVVEFVIPTETLSDLLVGDAYIK